MTIRNRINTAERVLSGIDDLQQLHLFKSVAKLGYNLPYASESAIIAALRAALGEIDLPGWAKEQLYAPIPEKDQRTLSVRRATIPITDDVLNDLVQRQIADLPNRYGVETLREAQWVCESGEREALPFRQVADELRAGLRQVPDNYA